MNRKPYSIGRCAAVCLTAVLVAATASARTVYDAGKALRENCTAASGAYANPYGVWSYDLADANGGKTEDFTAHGRFTHNSYGGASGAVLDGFTMSTAEQGRSVRVNVSGKAVTLSIGETIEIDELIMFPANYNDQYAHVRFTAPEAGWYSAYVFAHDLIRGAIDNTAGVEVRVLAQGNLLISQVVSQEDRATKRFDFQMPVRYLAAGETIDVLVGRNGGNSNDNTGVRLFVTKEDEGAFYDSGIAMTNNLNTSYSNPFGNVANGTWYYLKAAVPSSGIDFRTWAPTNFSKSASSRISTVATRSSGGQRGFGNNADGNAPYVVVNEGAAFDAATIAPCELHVHPDASSNLNWTDIRFRPPVSGYYSASVVARDINKGNSSANGVGVYLLASDHVLASAYISAETYSSTARLTFDARLLAAGEPVDVVVSPHGDAASDATAVSVIIRRELGIGMNAIYNAGTSFFENQAAGNSNHPFADSLGGGATWNLGAKTNVWSGAQFYSMPYSFSNSGDKLTWWVHSANNGSRQPRVAMATNLIASLDSAYLTTSPLLATIPFEFVVQPNDPNYQSSSPTLKAIVPSDGLYCVRSYARDLNGNTSGGDGVQVSIAANNYIPATAIVSRDGNTTIYEAAVAADRLWLKAGEKIEYVVDPLASNNSDATGISACYVREGDATAHVVNIDIAGSGAGRHSAYVGRGREGWGTAWNALRPGAASSAIAVNCREDDGDTPRNVSLSIERSSGAAITTESGSTGCAMLDSAVASTGAGDTYAFTISKLVPNAAYALYFYGTGDASFTVGGETKGLVEPWCAKDANVLARFDVTADANGEVSGTFSATSANGAAFGGLTLVGEFPEYDPPGMIIMLR